MSINPVKGTHDIYGYDAKVFDEIEGSFEEIATLYGYSKIQVPVLEHTELFDRGTGEGSDVVRKEMYTFYDKGGRSLTLRPEITAGIARSVLSNKLYVGDLPLKFFYYGPAFRYERPQAGRYREFNTFGVEAIGNDSMLLDVETILLAYTSLAYLGFKDLTLKVNTLGDKEGRKKFNEALRDYFSSHIEKMCDDCKERLKLNPLRILDCKVAEDQEIAKGAPKLSDFISEEAKDRYQQTVDLLEAFGIEVEEDPNLVRGLDYYSGLVFEIHARDESGQKLGALVGGGHYDNLLSSLGGPDLPGVGFGVGIERIASVYKANNAEVAPSIDVYLIALGERTKIPGFALTTDIRNLGYSCEMSLGGGKLPAQFKKAERRGARVIAIFGEDELDGRSITLKDQESLTEKKVSIDDLEEALAEMLDGTCGCGCHEHEHEGGGCYHHEHEEGHCCHHQEEKEENEQGHCCCHHHHEE